VNYDPLKDFVPISILGTNLFVARRAHLGAGENAQEFIDYVREHPGELNYSSVPATGNHLTMVLFASRAGLKMTHIPPRGARSR